MALQHLLRKEFIQIRRNSFIPRLILFFPIMVMCVMPWVMNMEVKNVVVDVVDNDRSTASQRLVHEIAANSYFIFHGQQPTYAAALQDIEQSSADIVVVIPPQFGRQLALGQTPQVLIAANAVNGTKGALGSNYLSQIVTAYVQPSAAALRDKTSTLFLFNKHLNFKLFMIPALFALIVMLVTGYLPTLNIVSEKEAGTIEQINVTPVKKWEFILAKLIPYWLIAFFVITVCLTLARVVHGVTPVGNVALIYLLSMCLAMFFSSFGLIVSNYSDTMQQAIFLMWFFVMILIQLSGLFTPTRSMPAAVYLTTYLNPVSYFIEAVRTVFIRGGNFGSIAHQVLALAMIDLLMGTWAVISYKKNR
jgi:putative ABC transporter, permease protein